MFIRGSTLLFFIVSIYQTSAKPRVSDCDECVSYNFESDFETLFTNDGMCTETRINSWTTNQYANISLQSPNDYSQTFITPEVDLSCVSSFPFTMTGGGTVEANVYIQTSDPNFSDQVQVLAEQITASGTNPTMGFGVRSSLDSNFANGWYTLTFTLFGSATFNGHLIFVGQNNYNSIVLVDSFCYKPASYSGDCWVQYTTTTAEPETTTEVVTEPTTVTEEQTEAVTEIETTTAAVTDATTTSEADSSTTDADSSTSDADSNTSAVTDATSVTDIDSATSDSDSATSDGDSTTSAVTDNDSTTSDNDSNTSVTDDPSATESTEEAASSTGLPTVTVPEPTLPTQAPGSDQCPQNPFIHWLLPHEEDCNLFYYCVWGEKVLRNCADGLHFNPILQVCDWPWNAGCNTTQ